MASVLGAVVGAVGVGLLVLRGGVQADAVGVAASLGAVGLSSVGYVLAKRWRPPVGMLTFAAWQLVAGGLVLVPVAALVEGAPPAMDARAVGGLPLHLRVRYGAGVRRVVHRPAPDARRSGRPSSAC